MKLLLACAIVLLAIVTAEGRRSRRRAYSAADYNAGAGITRAGQGSVSRDITRGTSRDRSEEVNSSVKGKGKRSSKKNRCEAANQRFTTYLQAYVNALQSGNADSSANAKGAVERHIARHKERLNVSRGCTTKRTYKVKQTLMKLVSKCTRKNKRGRKRCLKRVMKKAKRKLKRGCKCGSFLGKSLLAVVSGGASLAVSHIKRGRSRDGFDKVAKKNAVKRAAERTALNRRYKSRAAYADRLREKALARLRRNRIKNTTRTKRRRSSKKRSSKKRSSEKKRRSRRSRRKSRRSKKSPRAPLGPVVIREHHHRRTLAPKWPIIKHESPKTRCERVDLKFRRRERKRIFGLHLDAQQCATEDTECTDRNARKIVRMMKRIKRARAHRRVACKAHERLHRAYKHCRRSIRRYREELRECDVSSCRKSLVLQMRAKTLTCRRSIARTIDVCNTDSCKRRARTMLDNLKKLFTSISQHAASRDRASTSIRAAATATTTFGDDVEDATDDASLAALATQVRDVSKDLDTNRHAVSVDIDELGSPVVKVDPSSYAEVTAHRASINKAAGHVPSLLPAVPSDDSTVSVSSLRDVGRVTRLHLQAFDAGVAKCGADHCDCVNGVFEKFRVFFQATRDWLSQRQSNCANDVCRRAVDKVSKRLARRWRRVHERSKSCKGNKGAPVKTLDVDVNGKCKGGLKVKTVRKWTAHFSVRFETFKQHLKACGTDTACEKLARKALSHFLKRTDRRLVSRLKRCNDCRCRRTYRALLAREESQAATAGSSAAGSSTAREWSDKVREEFTRFRRAVEKCQDEPVCFGKARDALLSSHDAITAAATSRQEKCTTDECRTVYRRLLARLRDLRKLYPEHPLGLADASKSLASNQADAVDGSPESSGPLMMKMYRDLRDQLDKCPSGPEGKTCRHRVLRRFRDTLHGRETALIKMLRLRVRVQLQRMLVKCEQNLGSDSSSVATCVKDAGAKYAARLAHLRQRELEFNKRHAERQCESSADVKKCLAQVKTSFDSDMAIVEADASDSADAALKSLGVKQ